MKKTLQVIALAFLSTNLAADAATDDVCKPFTAVVSARIVHYVARKYAIPAENLIVAGNEVVVGSCYRKISLQSKSSGRELVFYVSPDQRFLVSSLFDLTIDPLAEERARAAARARALTTPAAPTIGDASSLSSIVVFSDFQCPFCGKLANVLEIDYRNRYKEEARILFRHFPLTIHAWARPAAMAAICVAEQDNEAFWQLHDLLFMKQKVITTTSLEDVLADFVKKNQRLNATAFAECRQSPRTRDALERDMRLASENQVTGTPTVFVNGNRVVGAITADELHKLVQLSSPTTHLPE